MARAALGKWTCSGEVHERLKYNKIKKRQAWFRYRRLEDGKTKSATTSRNYTKVNWARSFIDEPSHTYRCKSCAFASHRFEVQKARLEEIEGDKLRSESEHSRLWKAYYPELTPNFNWQAGLAARKKLLGEKGGKERLYGERHRAGTSRGKTLLVWDIPRKTVAVSLCLGCDELAFNPGSHPLEYHRPCYRERKTSLLRKRGPRTKNENLQKYISWAIGYCVSRSSLREIAAPDDDPTFALNRIKFIFRHFPVPVDKVQRRFRKFVSLLHTAAVKRGLFADDPTPEKLSDPHGKILAKNMSL